MAKKSVRRVKEKQKAQDVDGIFRCFKCSKEKHISEYYKSYSESFHHIPVCKACFIQILEQYREDYNSLPKAMLKICSVMDIYYHKGLIDSSLEKMEDDLDVKNFVYHYIRMVNSLTQYKGKIYGDSDVAFDVSFVDDMPVGIISNDSKNWGEYDQREYDFLNTKFEEYTEYYKPTNPTEFTSYRELCKQELILHKDPSNKDAMKARGDILKTLGIDAKSLKEEKNKNMEAQLIGQNIAIIEEFSPAEYYDDPQMFKDYFGRHEYLDKYYTRAVKNHVLGTHDFLDEG